MKFQILLKSASLSWYFSVEVYKCKCTPSSLGPTSQRVQMRAYPCEYPHFAGSVAFNWKLEDLSIFLPKVSSPPFLARPRRMSYVLTNELTMFQCKLLITANDHCTHLPQPPFWCCCQAWCPVFKIHIFIYEWMNSPSHPAETGINTVLQRNRGTEMKRQGS